MQQIDGFQTTDSFRFDRDTSSSSISLSSSSGYGSRLSLSSSSNRRIGLSKYFKEKLSRHKSLASLLLSSKIETINIEPSTQIYESVWNLDEQIDKLRSKINRQIHVDTQSIISMSVDPPEPIYDQILIDNDEDLLSAAAWYQAGLPRHICEEYLSHTNQPVGAFIIRHSYTQPKYPFVLSTKTKSSTVEHFLIERTNDNRAYRLQGSSKAFDTLSTLVLHHTIIPDILPNTLVLPLIHSTLTPHNDIYPQRLSSGVIRSVRF